MRANRILRRKRKVEQRKKLKVYISNKLKKYRIDNDHLLTPPRRYSHKHGEALAKYNADLLDYVAYKTDLAKKILMGEKV